MNLRRFTISSFLILFTLLAIACGIIWIVDLKNNSIPSLIPVTNGPASAYVNDAKCSLVIENKPIDAVKRAVLIKDFRFLVIGGFVEKPSGIDQTTLSKYGYRIVEGTSDDSPLCQDDDYQKAAYEYSLLYNQELLKDLRVHESTTQATVPKKK